MKKGFTVFLALLFSCNLFAQENTIGIGLVTDHKTNLSRSFAVYELLTENALTKDGLSLQPKIVDFVFNSTFGIEGIIYENNADLKLYQNGKKIKTIKCGNDWEIILNSIAAEIEKAGGFKLVKKYKKIDEGKQVNFYNRQILENLPGKLTIQVPDSRIMTWKSFNASIVKYKSKNPYAEIMKLYGNFGDANVNEIDIFKSGVPENFKAAIRPFVYPISRTMTYSLKLLGYGGDLMEKKDNNAAINCFFTSLGTSKEILASAKEVAILKSFAFKNISDIYHNAEGKQELSKILLLGYDLNTDFSNSKTAETSSENYYTAISRVKSLCENGAVGMRPRSGMGLQILGAISSGLSANASAFNDIGYDISSLTTSLASVSASASSQSANLQQESAQFFNQLSQIKDLVKAESFIVDGIDLGVEKNYVSSEVLYYLMTNPLEVKNSLLEYAKDKPKLKSLLANFYASKEEDKAKLIQDIYLHFSKIETVITGLEARNKVVEEKYKSNF